MGLLIGSTARDMRTAPAIANLMFFPMMFLSGSAMPFAFLPEGVQRFARLLPTTYLNDTYSSVIVRGEALLSLLASLAVADRHRRRRHRPDLDAVPLGRHRPDSAQGAGDDCRRVWRHAQASPLSPRRRFAWVELPGTRQHRARRRQGPGAASCAAPRSSTASAAASSTPASSSATTASRK